MLTADYSRLVGKGLPMSAGTERHGRMAGKPEVT